MAEVTETRLPGVGVRHAFSTASGEQLAVLSHRTGRREIAIYDRAEPDTCSTVLHLSPDDTRTLADLLGGASPVSEAVTGMQRLEGVAIDWIRIRPGAEQIGATIGEGRFRTRTGASVVALVRGDASCRHLVPRLRSTRAMSWWPSALRTASASCAICSRRDPARRRGQRRDRPGVHRDRRGGARPFDPGTAVGTPRDHGHTPVPARRARRRRRWGGAARRERGLHRARRGDRCAAPAPHAGARVQPRRAAARPARRRRPRGRGAIANFTPGLLVGLVLGWGPAAAVLLGGVCWVSSSGVVSKVLADLDRLGNRETPAVLNLLVFEDLAMAVYLPVIGAVVVGRGAGDTVVAIAIVAVTLILTIALRWGDHLSGLLAPASDEALLLAVFGLTLLVGGLAQEVQVSAAIGAFLVGLALSGSVQARAAAVVGPLRDLFAATFFLFFSFSVDPSDLVGVLVPAALLTLFGIGGKLVSGWVAAARRRAEGYRLWGKQLSYGLRAGPGKGVARLPQPRLACAGRSGSRLHPVAGPGAEHLLSRGAGPVGTGQRPGRVRLDRRRRLGTLVLALVGRRSAAGLCDQPHRAGYLPTYILVAN